jgi:hypothetical protein
MACAVKAMIGISRVDGLLLSRRAACPFRKCDPSRFAPGGRIITSSSSMLAILHMLGIAATATEFESMTEEQLIDYLIAEFRESPALAERILAAVRDKADPVVEIINDMPKSAFASFAALDSSTDGSTIYKLVYAGSDNAAAVVGLQ